jgi:hypothetical protein
MIILRERLKPKLLMGFMLVVLFILAPLSLSIYYYGEAEHVMSQAEYSGLTFLCQTLANKDVLFMDFAREIPYFTSFDVDVNVAPSFYGQPYNMYDYINVAVNKSTVVAFRISSFARYYKLEGSMNNSFTQAREFVSSILIFNRIYDDSDFLMYRRYQTDA